MNQDIIHNFSKFSKEKKIDWLLKNYLDNDLIYKDLLLKYLNSDSSIQKLHDNFSENTLSNFYLPFSIAPNFLIDGKIYAIPMVVEESSVVAAASKAAKFWFDKGGFKTKILSTVKLGHTHFIFDPKNQSFDILNNFFISNLKKKILNDTLEITKNMKKRGGGILSIELIDKTKFISGYYQLKGSFDTKDSMGANFINSCLEQFAKTLIREINKSEKFNLFQKKSLQIIMNIVSNYTPDCLVYAEVSCKINQLVDDTILNPNNFARKFFKAVQIAEIDVGRATTHNKGIMNGVDSLLIATGNDFRAVEAGVHTYAFQNGDYRSLSHCEVKKNIFKFWIKLPISVGVVGGVTKLHPLVKIAFKILKNPNSNQLMKFCAVLGLAQNFSALYSLITEGIQKGHMKQHFFNILSNFNLLEKEKEHLIFFFKKKTPNYYEVLKELNRIRKNNFCV